MKQLLSTLFLAFIFLTPISQAQHLKQEWTFVHKEDGQTRHFKQGQKITVKWNGLNGLSTSKGRLADITADSLVLSMHGNKQRIAKNSIEQISKKGRKPDHYILSIALFLGGIAIMAFFALIQFMFYTTRTDFQVSQGEKPLVIWPIGLVTGVVFIVFSFINLKRPTLRASRPFSEEWTIQEKPVNPNKMP